MKEEKTYENWGLLLATSQKLHRCDVLVDVLHEGRFSCSRLATDPKNSFVIFKPFDKTRAAFFGFIFPGMPDPI